MIVVMQVVPTKAEADSAEMYWIAHFRELGADLLNVTIGGPGRMKAVLPRKPTWLETKRRQSLASKLAHLKRGHNVW